MTFGWGEMWCWHCSFISLEQEVDGLQVVTLVCCSWTYFIELNGRTFWTSNISFATAYRTTGLRLCNSLSPQDLKLPKLLKVANLAKSIWAASALFPKPWRTKKRRKQSPQLWQTKPTEFRCVLIQLPSFHHNKRDGKVKVWFESI